MHIYATVYIMLNHRTAVKHVLTLHTHFWGRVILAFFILTTAVASYLYYTSYIESTKLKGNVSNLSANKAELAKQLGETQDQLKKVTSEDQFVKNKQLQEEIKNIENTYSKAATTYEKLLEFKTISKKTDEQDKLYAQSLKLLADRNFSSANTQLDTLQKQISDETAKIQATFAIPQNVASSNAPPGSGFSQQQVNSDIGTFLVSIIAADLGSSKVIVDTASDNDCHDNCPTVSLGDFVARNGAFAGINGSYFCPAAYPSCAGKTNSFDLLVMNKNKHYFNSDNNVYSTNPAFIFGPGWVRFVSKAQEWGRDTSVDGVISNFPALVISNQVVYDSSGDPKFNSKGPRCFVANKGNTVYIGIVYNADMRDSAHVLKTLGMDNAMNLDEGGSTALWFGGYKAGPGRALANALLFVRK
jgi:hypothetical protein